MMQLINFYKYLFNTIVSIFIDLIIIFNLKTHLNHLGALCYRLKL